MLQRSRIDTLTAVNGVQGVNSIIAAAISSVAVLKLPRRLWLKITAALFAFVLSLVLFRYSVEIADQFFALATGLNTIYN